MVYKEINENEYINNKNTYIYIFNIYVYYRYTCTISCSNLNMVYDPLEAF